MKTQIAAPIVVAVGGSYRPQQYRVQDLETWFTIGQRLAFVIAITNSGSVDTQIRGEAQVWANAASAGAWLQQIGDTKYMGGAVNTVIPLPAGQTYNFVFYDICTLPAGIYKNRGVKFDALQLLNVNDGVWHNYNDATYGATIVGAMEWKSLYEVRPISYTFSVVAPTVTLVA